ncbi:M1 family metallopeptidase [Psychroflexus sp. ALD_RP9]|uniref:M1 family metallopeptidase n=1 Tax=Psychroflexus sp. ALD_RP9 TaxID=2777186 RepID=UPI001A8FF586|nr:M1 family metallopeptidase [Psychroflexus sp. ALD_RP9]QSS97245.1 M1 family metallopeptidase [Psychroflexus sp. ALD_RP9]
MKSILVLLNLFITSILTAQHQPNLDVKRIKAEVTINDTLRRISAEVSIYFHIKSAVDSVFFDAQNFKSVNSNQFKFSYNSEKIIFYHHFKPNKSYKIDVSYQAKPKQTLYFTGKLGDTEFPLQIWTQGQGKYTSHWLPSLDDMRDKIEFDLTYTLPSQYKLVSNGNLKRKSKNVNLTTWEFDMQKPMSSYLVAFAAGNFVEETQNSNSGISIYNYLPAQDSLDFKSTFIYTQDIFNFLEQKIGVSYPWQNYKQIGVRDFLYAGMENTSCTIFSDEFITDSIAKNDSDFVNVEAHELAHQWFGNLVTETSAKHHWLHEGFATYFSYLAQEHLFGTPYFEHQLFSTAESLKLRSDQGKGQRLFNPNANSLTFYEKGAWALHALRNRVGDKVFFEAISQYLVNNAYKSVETDDFLAEVQSLTQVNLAQFKQDWLLQKSFPAEEAQLILTKSSFIEQLFELKALRGLPVSEKQKQLKEALLSKHIDYFGPEVALQLTSDKNLINNELLQLALETKHLKTRQVLIKNISKIPRQLQLSFEELLKDESYITREHALLKLWLNFPKKRSFYLKQTKGQDGNIHLNMKLLHLMLSALNNPDNAYQPVRGLVNYTVPEMPYQIKRQAFVYLFQLNYFDEESLVNLSEDLNHPVWRYRTFVKQLFSEIIKDKTIKASINQLMNNGKIKNVSKLKDLLKK